MVSVGAGGAQRLGLFWQNAAYPATGLTMRAFDPALASPKAGAAWCGDAATEVGVIGLVVSVSELVVSSLGVSTTAAKTMSPAAAVTPLLGGRTGGGLLSVSVVGVPVAAMITPLRRDRPGLGE